MTASPDTDVAQGDAALLAAVRAGDTAAYGELYDRHAEAARRLARALVPDPSDADDLVAEAFAKVLATLVGGGGPEQAFRAYLLTAVRHACYERFRRDRRLELTADVTRYESRYAPPECGAGEDAVATLDRSYAARAFTRLPERWQVVLWHTEVEGAKPAAVAPLLGLTPNAVAVLASRARERLRQMYLQEHLRITGAPSCRWTTDRLGAHVRCGLPPRERSKVDAHLTACRTCRTLWTELAEVNACLRGVLAPLMLHRPPAGVAERSPRSSGRNLEEHGAPPPGHRRGPRPGQGRRQHRPGSRPLAGAAERSPRSSGRNQELPVTRCELGVLTPAAEVSR